MFNKLYDIIREQESFQSRKSEYKPSKTHLSKIFNLKPSNILPQHLHSFVKKYICLFVVFRNIKVINVINIKQ